MRRHTVRRPDGYVHATGAYGTEEKDTQQCCHCSGHFDVEPGSGKTRGFCMGCMKVTCGNSACHEHFPFEERMDLYEKGLLPYLMAPREAAILNRINRG